MDIKSLTIFVELANSLHFGKTAKNHHMSPSTLSRVVQRLEDEVGCALLLRDNRSAQLTPAGEQLKAFAEQQLEQYQSLKLSLNQQQAKLTGKLHIFCSVTAAYSHLPDLLDTFRQAHPMVEIELTTGDASEALTRLQQQNVDISIAAKPDDLPSSYHFHHLAHLPLALIAPRKPCHVRQLITDKQINWSQVPIILAETGLSRSRFEKWYRGLQFGKPNIYANVAGHEAIVSMVAVGCGVALSPKVVVENSPVKERIEYLDHIEQFSPFELGIACLNIKRKQPLIRAFFDTLAVN